MMSLALEQFRECSPLIPQHAGDIRFNVGAATPGLLGVRLLLGLHEPKPCCKVDDTLGVEFLP